MAERREVKKVGAMTLEIRYSPILQIRLHGKDDERAVSAEGEVDLSTSEYLEDAVLIALRDRPSVLVVDLSGLKFMDSNGVISLLAARELCGELRCHLKLVLGPPVQRVLEVSGVLELFEVSLDRSPPEVRLLRD